MRFTKKDPTASWLSISSPMPPGFEHVGEHVNVLVTGHEALVVVDMRSGKTYNLAITDGTISGADLKLIKAPSTKEIDQSEHGLRVYDPGMDSTAVVKSPITWINGYTGKMQYRGYDLEWLAENKKFMEVAYLFHYGDLPSKQQHADFEEAVTASFKVDESVMKAIRAMKRDTLSSGLVKVALEAIRATKPHVVPVQVGKDPLHGNQEGLNKIAVEMIGEQAVVMALVHCHKADKVFRYPPAGMGYTEGVLFMMGIKDRVTGKVDPVAVDCLDRLFIAEGDVDLNTGVFALYTATSTLNDPYAALSALVTAAEGISHGNALELICRDIAAIGSIDNIPATLAKVRNREFRLMGFGGRRWKVPDPRLAVAQRILDTYMGHDAAAVDPQVGVARALVDAVATDPFFVERKLFANADLLMSFAFRAIGFPSDMLYPMCVLARTPAAMAQYALLQMGPVRMWLPSQVYSGKIDRETGPVKAKL